MQRIFENKNLRNHIHVFRDRSAGGHALAELLREHREDSAVLLAIPSGGVPVALAIATDLSLPLDFMIVSKITFSWNTEAGYGAVAYDGTYKLNEDLIRMFRLKPNEVQEGIERTNTKVAVRLTKLRNIRQMEEIAGRTAILVDDGLASGFTMHVAVEVARKLNARKVIVAVPTGHESSVHQLSAAADAVYCANVRSGSAFAVGRCV
jgi:putative phosphoribosyl transferase